MQAGENRGKIWDPSPFRPKNLTFWPRSHPVLFPHVHTDHWTKMKARVPSHLVSLPGVMEKGVSRAVAPLPDEHGESEQNLPLLRPFGTEILQLQPCALHSAPCGRASPQTLPQYRNEYNDRARRGFRYWLIEKKVPKSYGYSFGAYKTLLGLPRV
ncbi:hypothetical protein SKAU_G00105710 [Synaphobranchus kaupii]|uniref:Uncharacterized protein n=1 Tax=Synaphobranchus kaupii TaxID=118154 RepID=A0A9Q1G079_SYNKA|nr:hypothetical protein SKAU_G00105710 [Synaphobranchus kaupii]